MRYKNNIRANEVIYKDSYQEGFTCVDVDVTAEENIYSVAYELFTEGFNYILYTTRTARPAFIIKDGVKYTLNVNDMGGWHLTDYDKLDVDRMGRLGAVFA